MNWSPGESVSALGEKYLRAIRATVPDKPVRFVVLTHHHSDHIGGVRPFIADNVTILAGEAAAHMAEAAAAAPLILYEDALSRTRLFAEGIRSIVRFFVVWLDASELNVERIYNVHGRGLVEDWQLEAIRAMGKDEDIPEPAR